MRTVQARPIPGYPYYFASREGDIYRLRRGVLNPVKSRIKRCKGYAGDRDRRLIDLSVNGELMQDQSVGNLVCWAFVGSTMRGEAVTFLDGDATNTRADNVEWSRFRGMVGNKLATYEARRVERLRLARGLPIDWHPRDEYSDADVVMQVEGDFEHDRESEGCEVPR